MPAMNTFRRCLALVFCMALAGAVAGADYRVETWVSGLDEPRSIAFLPDGTALLTELGGTLRRIQADGTPGPPIANVPGVYRAGQGGLLDVVLHPDFGSNRLIYLSYAEGPPADNGTAVARGRLSGGALEQVETIFRNLSRKDTPVHYGGRLAFLADGSLLLTTGEGFNYREAAQDISGGLGKVLRMNDDGSPAQGNPFPGSPWVYSYGLRNPQGLAVSRDGTVWLHDHGPRGGDELNRVEAGANYGWPAVTHGIDYTGAVISPYRELEGMVPPIYHWTPAIAPSGLAVYEAELFSGWRGNLLVGALKTRDLRRLELAGGRVRAEHVLLADLGQRIRDVHVGPDGAVYVLTPESVLRLWPAQAPADG
jgi:glucose/arabinose dehydrogenase